MQLYSRKKGKVEGVHPVYDNIQEFLATEAPPFRFIKPKDPSLSDIRVGDWFIYPSGRIAKILSISKSGKVIYTVLNPISVYVAKLGYEIKDEYIYGYRLSKKIPVLDLNVLDPPKLAFAEDWLLNGFTLWQAVRRNFYRYIDQYTRQITTKHTIYKCKLFGYTILSGPWFDELLRTNRVLREKYMTMINALKNEGMDEAYAAAALKHALEESKDTKERMNALNKLLDIIAADEHRRASRKPELPTSGVLPPEELEEYRKNKVILIPKVISSPSKEGSTSEDDASRKDASNALQKQSGQDDGKSDASSRDETISVITPSETGMPVAGKSDAKEVSRVVKAQTLDDIEKDILETIFNDKAESDKQ